VAEVAEMMTKEVVDYLCKLRLPPPSRVEKQSSNLILVEFDSHGIPFYMYIRVTDYSVILGYFTTRYELEFSNPEFPDNLYSKIFRIIGEWS